MHDPPTSIYQALVSQLYTTKPCLGTTFHVKSRFSKRFKFSGNVLQSRLFKELTISSFLYDLHALSFWVLIYTYYYHYHSERKGHVESRGQFS